MNAGAYNYTVSDNIISVECISEESEVIILKKINVTLTIGLQFLKTQR